jgi:pyruvate formate lyase activating enzyme
MIRSFLPLSLSDWPGELASVVFTGGCDFRCPWCHNRELIFPRSDLSEYGEKELIRVFRKRRHLVRKVVVTGGEPLLWGERLLDFLRALREEGFGIQLDTNGNHPDALRTVLSERLADRIGMDVKNIPGKYAETVGIPGYHPSNMEHSLSLVRSSQVAHVFRCTLVPGMVQVQEMLNFAEARKIELRFQEFRPPALSKEVFPGILQQ